MNTERYQNKLTSEISKKSVNNDTFFKINLDSEERLLPSGDILKVINVADRFNEERQSSSKYRVLGSLNLTASNPLFNLADSPLSDLYTWKGFNYYDLQTGEYRFGSIFPTVINDTLKEKNGWFGYFNPSINNSGPCNFLEMEPKSQRFSFLSDNNPYHSATSLPIKNWDITLTYPASIDSGHTLVNNGLLIVGIEPAIVSTRGMTAFAMPCLHNLTIGDRVKIDGTNGYDGEHTVIRTGLDNGDLKPYYFVIDKPFTGTTSGNSRMKKIFGGVESTYYFRKFRKLKTTDGVTLGINDCETYKLAFSENYFNEANAQFLFNKDVDVDGLRDNLNRPLSEIYLTMIKTDSNNLFGLVSSGIETPIIPQLNNSDINTYLLDVPVINRIHNGGDTPFTSHIPLESGLNFTNNNNDFYGDLVEYNTNQLIEIPLAHVSHRFNTLSRETPNQTMTYNLNENTTATIDLGPRQEGYYYKAHNLIKIREFSSYIEQGNRFTVGIPDYAIEIDGGRFVWRDLLEIGFSQNGENRLDYPFINGSHYLYDNLCFSVKRQDPFSNWGLYYENFPADPIGSSMTDNFTTNTSENVC